MKYLPVYEWSLFRVFNFGNFGLPLGPAKFIEQLITSRPGVLCKIAKLRVKKPGAGDGSNGLERSWIMKHLPIFCYPDKYVTEPFCDLVWCADRVVLSNSTRGDPRYRKASEQRRSFAVCGVWRVEGEAMLRFCNQLILVLLLLLTMMMMMMMMMITLFIWNCTQMMATEQRKIPYDTRTHKRRMCLVCLFMDVSADADRVSKTHVKTVLLNFC